MLYNMINMYKPPFSITEEMLNLSMSISEKVAKIPFFDSLNRMPILRRNSQIKSIYSSLAIEANSLSISQVKDVIDGKIVIGEQKEITEVKNAYKAYEMISEFDGYLEKDCLKAHSVLTNLILSDSGKFRDHEEGVFDGDKVIFVAPPAHLVPKLVADLFDWLQNDLSTPLLIKSCIFHYEFVFIHPFSDGNGRIARLWQNVLLMKWNKIFKYIPIESNIKEWQAEYYRAISESHKRGDSNVFIEFMLKAIDKSLDEVLTSCEKEKANISEQVNGLLEVMEYGVPLSANEIMKRLNVKSKETLRSSYLNPAMENGLVEMTLPDKPNSKNQRYVKK